MPAFLITDDLLPARLPTPPISSFSRKKTPPRTILIYGWDNPQPGGDDMMPVETRERPFELEAWGFWERVRKLTEKGREATGGPMGKAGGIFDLLDAVCNA
jgi:hypothetical protein